MPRLSKPAFNRAMDEFDKDAAGAFNIWTVPPERAMELVAAALAGDKACGVMMTVIAETAETIIAFAKRQPCICLCCPQTLRTVKGCTFAILAPELDYGRGMICSAICQECYRGDGLNDRIMAAITKVWPQARKIDVHPHAGNA